MPQYIPLGVVDAPAAWPIPSSLELAIGAVFAHFDGSGAAGSYIPTLEVLSDSGHTVVEVPQDASVAAGSSVVASWAPFLKTSGAGSPGPPGPPGGSGGEPTPFQPFPFTALFYGGMSDVSPFDAWGSITDANAIAGLWTNSQRGPNGPARTPALNDYFTFPIMLGPKGSAWSCFDLYKLQPNGGTFKVTIGSVTDTSGQLQDSDTVTYLNPLALGGITYSDDTYQGVTSYDGGSLEFSQSVVIGGNDGDAFTGVTGIDPATAYPIINGGAGAYRCKVQVTGKNAASTGFRVDLMGMAWGRADSNGLI